MGKIIRKTLKEVMQTPDNTDWKKVDAITEEELDEMVKNNPDDVYLTDEDFASGQWVKRNYTEPKKKEQITIRLDEDILSFFRGKGKGYQSRINNALRAFMAAQRERRSS